MQEKRGFQEGGNLWDRMWPEGHTRGEFIIRLIIRRWTITTARKVLV